MGFRGEALASIAAVSRLTLTSRAIGASHAWRLNGDSASTLEPAALIAGTVIEMRDLYNTRPGGNSWRELNLPLRGDDETRGWPTRRSPH